MRDLPIHPERNAEHGLSLARRRDRILSAAEQRPEVLREAIEALALECVRETLRLTGGPDVSGRDIRQVALAGEKARVELDPASIGLVEGQIEALQLIETRARAHPALDVSLVREVHRLSTPDADGSLRRKPIAPRFGSVHSRPELVPAQLENLMEWLGAESGRSMYPPERATLAFARLLEIAPFERGNFRTAHLLLSFFAFAEGYPPLYLRYEEAEEVRAEVERAMAFDTLPLVNRLSAALARSLRFCERELGENGGR